MLEGDVEKGTGRPYDEGNGMAGLDRRLVHNCDLKPVPCSVIVSSSGLIILDT